MLIHAGDFTDWGSIFDIGDFSHWLSQLSYKYVIVIAGNHDVKFESYPDMAYAALRSRRKDVIYLQNRMVEIEGLRIFGSPYTPRFTGGFQLDNSKSFWRTLIPDGVDIVVTHGPPYGILDEILDCHEGDSGLLERLIEVKPKLHVFGHIHESYGVIKQRYGIKFVNASCGFQLNKPIVVDI